MWETAVWVNWPIMLGVLDCGCSQKDEDHDQTHLPGCRDNPWPCRSRARLRRLHRPHRRGVRLSHDLIRNGGLRRSGRGSAAPRCTQSSQEPAYIMRRFLNLLGLEPRHRSFLPVSMSSSTDGLVPTRTARERGESRRSSRQTWIALRQRSRGQQSRQTPNSRARLPRGPPAAARASTISRNPPNRARRRVARRSARERRRPSRLECADLWSACYAAPCTVAGIQLAARRSSRASVVSPS